METDGPATFEVVSGGVTQMWADVNFSFGGSNSDSSEDVVTYDNGQITHLHTQSEARSRDNHVDVDVTYSDGRTREVIAEWSRDSLREITPDTDYPSTLILIVGDWTDSGGKYDLTVTGTDAETQDLPKADRARVFLETTVAKCSSPLLLPVGESSFQLVTIRRGVQFCSTPVPTRECVHRFNENLANWSLTPSPNLRMNNSHFLMRACHVVCSSQYPHFCMRCSA